jgi:hypothetical protein
MPPGKPNETVCKFKNVGYPLGVRPARITGAIVAGNVELGDSGRVGKTGDVAVRDS